MKMNQLILTGVAAFGILCVFASTAVADNEADYSALRMIRTNYMEAVNSGDLSKIAPFLSKDVTGVMVTGDEVKGFGELESYWKKIQDLIGPGGSYHQKVNADKTDLYDGVAVSRGTTEDLVRLGSGKELRFNSYWTAVCRKEDGVWKVLRMEATMNPVDNVFVSMNLQKTKVLYGLGGIVAGTILVLIVRFSLSSRTRGPSDARPHPAKG